MCESCVDITYLRIKVPIQIYRIRVRLMPYWPFRAGTFVRCVRVCDYRARKLFDGPVDYTGIALRLYYKCNLERPLIFMGYPLQIS